MFPASFRPFVFLLLVGAIAAIPLLAQENQELRFHYRQAQIPVKNWAAPLYFRPSEEESALMKRNREEMATDFGNLSSAVIASSSILDPSVPLVFVATTPCRLMDTRSGSGQTGAFGPPALAGGTARTVPIPTHPVCSVPATSLAYSLNVTVIPQGSLGFLTIWPAGQPQPLVSTLNSLTGQIIANAAIVPAGTSGSVNIYVSNTTDVVLDINGYYVPQTVLALGAGTMLAPSLTFSNDANSGLYSPSAGTIDITSGGNNILTVNASGINVSGNISSTGVISGNGSGLTNVPVNLNLQSGATLRGFWGQGWTASAAGEFHETYIAFLFTLASAPTAHFIAVGTTPPAGCPGTSVNPQADPGHLCVYEDNTGNTNSKFVCSSGNCPGATPWGAQLRGSSIAAGTSGMRGTWAVTAP